MNKLVLHIARRYLFSKKSTNVINIISGISMAGIAVGAMALIVVLSAFNGLEKLVESLYSSFDPEIKITAKLGKTFSEEEFPKNLILELDEVAFYSRTLEETVVVKYKDHQTYATLKGVDNDFAKMSRLDSMMYEGRFKIYQDNINYAVLGYGIADKLGVFIENALEPMYVYAAKRTKQVNPNPSDAFKVAPILPSGIFAINPDFDNKFVLCSFSFAENLLGYSDRISAVELGLKKGISKKQMQQTAQKIQAILGNNYEVKTRFQINDIIYKTNQTEKWITFMILSFILVVATFNLVGSLAMLVMDKRQDIFILRGMGATKKLIRAIFFTEGMLITLIGGSIGIILGLVLTLLQQHVGLVPLSGVIVDFYPMEIRVIDIVAVFSMVFIIGLLASWFPAKLLVNRFYKHLVREV